VKTSTILLVAAGAVGLYVLTRKPAVTGTPYYLARPPATATPKTVPDYVKRGADAIGRALDPTVDGSLGETAVDALKSWISGGSTSGDGSASI